MLLHQFRMNSVVRQLHEQGADIEMVDTGNSYVGLCGRTMTFFSL